MPSMRSKACSAASMFRAGPSASGERAIAAAAAGGVSEPATRLYFLPEPMESSHMQSARARLRAAIQELDDRRPEPEKGGRRGLRLLLLGRQHHGKSSLLNHLVRCLRQRLDVGDEVETGPPSEMETTVEVRQIEANFEDFTFTLFDSPAFSVLNQHNIQRLQDLLTDTNDGWRRHKSNRKSRFAAPKRPDAAVVVVSLEGWRDEREEPKEYLQKLQAELKRATRNDVVLPFVVAATHADAFQEEAGNDGKDPEDELQRALKDLRQMANTNNVYAITNYTSESKWTRCSVEATYKLLRDVTTLAKNAGSPRRSRSECALRAGSAAGVLGCVTRLVLCSHCLCH